MSLATSISGKGDNNRLLSFKGTERRGEAPDTQALLERLARGDKTAFWPIWEQHRKFLYTICLSQMKGDRANAEDALSRAMLKAWDKLPVYASGIIDLKAWMARLTYNLCVEIVREFKRQINRLSSFEEMGLADEESVADSFESPEAVSINREMRRRITSVVSDLPSPLREPFILRIEHEMEYQDIAARLRLSPENVRKRIQQARAILRTELYDLLSGSNGTSKNSLSHRQRAAFAE